MTLQEQIKEYRQTMNDDNNPGWFGDYHLCGPTTGYLVLGNPDVPMVQVGDVTVMSYSDDIIQQALDLGGYWYNIPDSMI